MIAWWWSYLLARSSPHVRNASIAACKYDHHQAITAYQEAYDLDESNETSKSKLAGALVTRGLWYRSLGDDYYDEAADDFQAALDLYPDDADYQDYYDSVS